MMILSACLYLASFCAQSIAALYAVNLYLRSKSYRAAFGFLALALCLMLGRRIAPLVHVLNYGHIDLPDALLSLPISLCLLFGMLLLRRLLVEYEHVNFQLERLAKFDALTGALSRTELFLRAKTEIERSLRSGHSISFLMIDIDHFKNVNDHYGHQVGDAVLVNLVKSCQQQLRAIDIFGRVGGEEFFLILPKSAQDEAYLVAERIRGGISEAPTLIEGAEPVFITISIGIAVYSPRHLDKTDPEVILKKFFKMSDDAMYQAKSKGRNRTELWSQ
ncbi:MAG: GGDEF domain-containing protein [Polynucleobacter sp.]